MPLHHSRHQMPVADPGVIAEIARHFGLAVQPGLADEIEPDIVGDHGADRVEIARVEMRDIGAEPFAIGIRQFLLRRVIRLFGDFPQLRAAAMQCCLGRGQAAIHHLADFLQASSRARPSGSRWSAAPPAGA